TSAGTSPSMRSAPSPFAARPNRSKFSQCPSGRNPDSRRSAIPRSILVLIVTTQPRHRERQSSLVAAFGREIEIVVGTVQHVDPTRVAGICVEDRSIIVAEKDTDA